MVTHYFFSLSFNYSSFVLLVTPISSCSLLIIHNFFPNPKIHYSFFYLIPLFIFHYYSASNLTLVWLSTWHTSREKHSQEIIIQAKPIFVKHISDAVTRN